MASCTTARSVPSRSAASFTRCQVSGRWPKVKVCWRVSTTRTERCSCSAAMTARMSWYCGRSPEPKAPPTNGLRTVTLSLPRPNTRETIQRLFCGLCVLS